MPTDMPTDEDRRAHTDRIVDALLDSLRRNDMRAFADLWAPDGTVQFPFAPPGYPVLRSRDEVWDYVKDFDSVIRLGTITEHRRHHTLDPGTAIVEYSGDGVAVQTGSDYRMGYISVITTGPDGIVEFKDYWNSLAAVTALGGVDAVMTAFTQERNA
ncbi:nuclear transport factor 2 family protein [Mycolicibacterium vaccae]|uniref:nuclear transport factor 2 family protein n=1 Tax=Mycolicibacterium vaccae TaxID=1810 RepID=UPI003CE86522